MVNIRPKDQALPIAPTMRGSFQTLDLPPPGLGNLPLYKEDDGFYSVTGPRLDADGSEGLVTHPSNNQISNPANRAPNVSFNLQAQANTITKLDTPLGSSLPHTPNHMPPTQSLLSPGKPPRNEYVCNELGCTWKFPTKQGLDRHHESKHLKQRYDCPVPGCENVGKKGIKRRDNLRVHVLNQHGVELPRGSLRT